MRQCFAWLDRQEEHRMQATTRLLHTWRHWLMVGSLLLAAGLGLDAAWIHARVALAQWLGARADARSGGLRRARARQAERT
jgi:hypothetical protein